jgi:7,8-dihydro-6-hydroxymethylpterin-pyrophosphokinase
MHERGFVLQPVCDVACAMTHPILGRTMGELLAEVSTEGVRRLEAGPW